MQYAIDQRSSTTPATRVINFGVAGPHSDLIAAKVLAIKDVGMALVAPAGDGNTTDTTNAFPGADPNTAFRVMATDVTDCRAWFSNFSPSTTASQYNIAAPGWNIYSTLPRAGFGAKSGTQMASAVVAGSAALVWGQQPTTTVSWLISRMTSASAKSIKCGFAATARRVDVRKAITLSTETTIIGQLLDPFTGREPTGPTATTYIRLKSGTTQLAYSYTNNGGYYGIGSLAAGSDRNLTGDRTGYINTMLRFPITITTGIVAGPYLDALPRARPMGMPRSSSTGRISSR